MKKISEHISYEEATNSKTASRRGIDNTPDADQLKKMKLVAENCFEPVREAYGYPIGVSSFFRSEALNTVINGAKRSAHKRGEAIDIDADIFDNGISNADIFEFIKEHCEFTQLIWEFGDDKNPGWVHVSYDENNLKKEVLIAKKINGRTKYSLYND